MVSKAFDPLSLVLTAWGKADTMVRDSDGAELLMSHQQGSRETQKRINEQSLQGMLFDPSEPPL